MPTPLSAILTQLSAPSERRTTSTSEAPWVTLFFLPTVHGVQESVKGFRVLPNGWWDLEDVWLDE